MSICSVGFSIIRHLLSSQITVLNTNAILAQVLQLKTISNEVLIRVKKFISFPINNMSSTYGFINIIQLPLTFLNIQASSFIPDENKLFWQFHHKKIPTPLCQLQFITGYSRLASILASFESTKHFGRITYTSFVIFPCRNFCFDVHSTISYK